VKDYMHGVAQSFSNLLYVIFYVIAMFAIFLSFQLITMVSRARFRHIWGMGLHAKIYARSLLGPHGCSRSSSDRFALMPIVIIYKADKN